MRRGKSREVITEFFKQKFCYGYIKEIYPLAAMELNAGITIDLIACEMEI